MRETVYPFSNSESSINEAGLKILNPRNRTQRRRLTRSLKNNNRKHTRARLRYRQVVVLPNGRQKTIYHDKAQ